MAVARLIWEKRGKKSRPAHEMADGFVDCHPSVGRSLDEALDAGLAFTPAKHTQASQRTAEQPDGGGNRNLRNLQAVPIDRGRPITVSVAAEDYRVDLPCRRVERDAVEVAGGRATDAADAVGDNLACC